MTDSTVLIADDNDDARTSLGWLFQHHGFRVLEARTAADALRLAETRPDLIVLDVVLPDGNGLAVCRQLRAGPHTARTPVLMVSGKAVLDRDRVQALDGGADAYLTKPVDPAVLLAQAKALLRIRQAEEHLWQIESRFRAVVESSADPIVGTDPDGLVRTWNPAAERLFGYAAQEMVGHPGLVLVPARLEAEVQQLVARAKAGEPVPVYETVRVARGGFEVPVAVSLSAVRAADGKPAGLVAVYRDLAAERRAEEHLRQAQKMDAVGQLAGGIAHDFNNLLTVINGYADIAADALPAGHPARDLITEMRKAGERAAGLTRQLLAFSRKAVLAPRVVDPNALVLDIEQMLRRLIGEDVDLAVRPRPGTGAVHADPGQLEQVLLNLAVNARDAMPTGGKLTIETRDVELDDGYARSHPEVRPGWYVLLAVTDTGCGIPADVLPHVFEPFFTTKGPGKGTGLGLATVHGIVRQAGGHVGVYSEVGVGTTFKMYLPRSAESCRPSPGASGDRAPPGGTETILLVEDEEAVRALAGLVLRRAGYTVLEAGDGEAAVRAAAQHAGPLDLVVTDVVMPGFGGRELAERLRAARPGLEVLFLSGYTDDAVVRHGVLEEHVHFLQKPFSPLALALKVRQVLDVRR